MATNATATTVSSPAVTTEFGVVQLRAAAKAYADNKAIVDAVAKKYNSLDDAIAALNGVWHILQDMSLRGAGYTPSAELGFGSSNAAQIADALMGVSTSVSETRKSMVALAK